MQRSQGGTSLTWCRHCTPILEEAQLGGSECARGEDVKEVWLGTLAAGEQTAHVPAKHCTVHTGPGSSSPPGLPSLIWNNDFLLVNSCWTSFFFLGRAISPFFCTFSSSSPYSTSATLRRAPDGVINTGETRTLKGKWYTGSHHWEPSKAGRRVPFWILPRTYYTT